MKRTGAEIHWGFDVMSHDKWPYNVHLNLTTCPEARETCTTFSGDFCGNMLSNKRVVYVKTRAAAGDECL